MKKTLALVLLIGMLIYACATGIASTLPELHTIPADESMGTLNDEDGADAFQNTLDHADSRYFVINDYYNMASEGSLHILPHFETYQQTTEYSCGCAAALMALNHYGIRNYNEMEIAELAGTSPFIGTTVEGLVAFFEGAGFRVDYHADTERRFDVIEDFEQFLIETIDSQVPVLVDWVDWGGHWQVIIGIDMVSESSPYDDVLILADPYDVTDHCQDGYYVFPFGRFFDMWREGFSGDKAAPYEQPYIVVYPKE